MPESSIESLIPHRPPMLLVDEIVEQDEHSIICRKRFREDEFFVQGHYPGQPIVPGVILCECAAQSGALLLSANFVRGQQGEAVEESVPVLTRMNDVRFKQIVRPGDEIEIRVTLEEVVSRAYFLAAKVLVDGKTAVRLGFACTLASGEATR